MHPCRTDACKQAEREGEKTWWIVGEGWRNFERRDIRRGKDTWYITFPPGPAVMMFPAVAVFGLALWEEIFQPLPGAFVNPFQSAPLDMYSTESKLMPLPLDLVTIRVTPAA